jgi:tRNA1Val (adenine37-N6)-methyltransferase
LRFDAVNHFHQPAAGYRFSTDSILLAEFADLKKARRVADLGAGCGVVGLCALEKDAGRAVEHLFFVEREESFFPALPLNVALYQPRARAALAVIRADWRRIKPEDCDGAFDYILVNPPYFPQKSGRPCRSAAREAARREAPGGLAQLCQALARLLKPAGRAAAVFPAARRADLERELAAVDITPARARLIPPEAESRPRLMLLEGVI